MFHLVPYWLFFRITQYITPISLFYKNMVILLGGYLTCEELVGVTQMGMIGIILCR